MTPTSQVIFSFDAETIGLYGDPFAVSYVICDRNTGKELEKGYLSCPFENASGKDSDRAWVLKNVVPHLPKETNCNTPDEVCETFYQTWMKTKEKYKEVIAIADCGYPVETSLFARAIRSCVEERKYTGPYPLHEVATALLLANMNSDDYPRIENELPEHNPLNDAKYAARLFLTALKKADQARSCLESLSK